MKNKNTNVHNVVWEKDEKERGEWLFPFFVVLLLILVGFVGYQIGVSDGAAQKKEILAAIKEMELNNARVIQESITKQVHEEFVKSTLVIVDATLEAAKEVMKNTDKSYNLPPPNSNNADKIVPPELFRPKRPNPADRWGHGVWSPQWRWNGMYDNKNLYPKLDLDPNILESPHYVYALIPKEEYTYEKY